MAKSITVKKSADPVPPVTQTAAASTSVVNNSNILTVVVVDEKGQPTAGATVSIKPSDASAVTNGAGEVQFKLGTATKYDITASYSSHTVTVPYYVTSNGSTRLVVNPIYVQKVEQQLHPSFFHFGLFSTIGIGLGILVVLFIIWRLFRRR